MTEEQVSKIVDQLTDAYVVMDQHFNDYEAYTYDGYEGKPVMYLESEDAPGFPEIKFNFEQLQAAEVKDGKLNIKDSEGNAWTLSVHNLVPGTISL